MRIAPGALVLLLGAAAAGADAYATLKDINDQVNEARKALLQKVGANLDAEKAAIDATDQKLAKARAQLVPALQSQGEAFKAVHANLDDAENWLANTRAAWEAERMLQEAERAKPPPSDQQLAAVEAKVKIFEERARVEWKPVGAEQMRRVRAMSFSMPASMALKPTPGGSGGGGGKAADAGAKAADGGAGKADAGTAAPPPPARKADGNPPRLDAILDAAWANDDDKAAGDALATALHATLVKTARAPLKGDAKHADVAVEAKVDQCYLVPFVLSTGDMPKDSWRLQYGSPVQAFSLQSPPAALVLMGESGPHGVEAKRDAPQQVYGFCALKSGKVTMSLDAPEAPGTKTTLRHAILTFARATLPEELLGYLTIGAQFDRCDADAFASYFLKPLPGTLVYRDNEPVIITSVGADKLGVLHMNAVVDEVSFGKLAPGWFDKTGMTAVAALGKLKFPPLGEFGGCPDNGAHGTAFAAVSKKLVDCQAKVEKKHPKADDEEANAKDLETLCAPLAKKAEKDLKKAYDKIVDEFAEKKPANALSHKWVNWLKGQPKQ